MLLYRKKKLLVLRLRDPERVTSVIPKSKVFEHNGKEFVAVKHGVEEVKVLRNIGIEAPSPIKYYYDWPGRFRPFKHQEHTAEFLTLNHRAFNLNDLGCVDSETEYLTPTGWNKISSYEGGLVGQYIPESGAVEFVEPIEYVKKPCPSMFHIKTKYGIDQMLSPEHRVLLVSKENPTKREVVQAADLFARQSEWLATGKNKKSLKTIGWSKAAVPVTYSVTGGCGIGLTEEQLRVQIAVIADGHFSSPTTRCVVRLKRDRKISRMRSLLRAANIQFKEATPEYESARGFSVFTFDAPINVKEFDSRFWAASNDELAVVRDEVMHWDGSFRKGKPTREFTSNSRASADFVQYAFNAGGFTARIVVDDRGPTYSVIVRDNGRPLQVVSSSQNRRNAVMSPRPSTDGFKYCFMVPSTFLIFRRNGCVFASGNTGKTVSTLWAYDYLRSIGLVHKVVVITPLSTLERTWADEVFQHFPHLTASVLYGSREKRLKMLNVDADIYLINHDGIKVNGIVDAINARDDIDLVIVDELAQVARTSGTDRYKALQKIINKGKSPRKCWGLTGLPIPNGPMDAWAQCRLLVPERVSPYAGRFKEQVMRQVSQYVWIPKPNALDVVQEAMQPAIRYHRDECIDLPPCTYETRTVELTAPQKAAYKEMLAKLAAEIDGGQVTAANEAVKAQKLIQIACGVVYGKEGEALQLESQPRLEVCKETIEESATKVIVFVPFVAVVQHVTDYLRKFFTVECIHRDVPKTERDRIFSDFQKTPNPKVLVASPATMSHGLTLTEASTIIWFGPIASNDIFEQANGRITRPGQKQNQLIMMIEGSDVERRYYSRLKDKQRVQGTLLDMVQSERVA